MIIDIHTHLGDILYPDGGRLIFREGVKKDLAFDIIGLAEAGLYKTNVVTDWILQALCANMITKAGKARNDAGTLENMKKSMKESGVAKSACMPIAPHVTFDDLCRTSERDSDIIPFTGIDFKKKQDVQAQLKSDVERGARGLKLHPIIQKEPLDSRKTFEAVEAFSMFGLPVLFHCGVQSYYLGSEKTIKETPEFGGLEFGRKLASAFPKVTFIAGHAGIFQFREAIRLYGGMKNVCVDTSFQAPGNIKELVGAFGPERVMYASDWPWGSSKTAVACVEKAFKKDKPVRDLLLFENASRLLKLSA